MTTTGPMTCVTLQTIDSEPHCGYCDRQCVAHGQWAPTIVPVLVCVPVCVCVCCVLNMWRDSDCENAMAASMKPCASRQLLALLFPIVCVCVYCVCIQCVCVCDWPSIVWTIIAIVYRVWPLLLLLLLTYYYCGLMYCVLVYYCVTENWQWLLKVLLLLCYSTDGSNGVCIVVYWMCVKSHCVVNDNWHWPCVCYYYEQYYCVISIDYWQYWYNVT